MWGLLSFLLIAAALAFAYSMGAHYTGACMGMPYSTGAIGATRALLLMAPLTFLGALLASESVEATVGHGLLGTPLVPLLVALGILASAFGLTTAYNFAKVPTSTIQILVFAIVGAGLADGRSIAWGTIGELVALWSVAPFAAFLLGAGFVRLTRGADRPPPRLTVPGWAAGALVAVGAGASFAMGANDVSNATGGFLMTGLVSPVAAAAIGGVGLAAGVLTWGRPLLQRVAFDIVELDQGMATSAQLAQASLILVYVAFGFFTSMNQALVGAMLGTAVARGQRRIRWSVVRGILFGWAVGPATGAAAGFALTALLLRLPGLG